MGKVIMSGIVPKLEAPNVLPPIGTALNDLTWEQIRAISDAGVAGNYFSVGDIKSIIINGKVGNTTFSNLAVDVFIIGIDHNASVEGTGIHFQIGKISGTDICLYGSNANAQTTSGGSFTMNTRKSNIGGWNGCYMRKTILGSNSNPTAPASNTLLAALPSDLRAVMKPITKYTDNSGNVDGNIAAKVTATTDYLPLLAEFEVYGVRYDANSAEQNYQKQYDYYKAGNSMQKYQHTSKFNLGYWWSRSVPISTSVSFVVFNRTGITSIANANYSYGLAPAFRV